MGMSMYKVLIVEDDPMVAMINEQYISRNKNFTVVEKCKDGRSALEFLKSNPVDLIILDVFMPYADGFETLRQIRKNKIPVEAIMVTAANDKESLEEALHLGVVDYLVKPFTFDRFRMALDKFIVQMEALKDLETLNQKNIDFIIDASRKKSEDIHPKGIQEKTLQLIVEHLKEDKLVWLTGDAIAEKTGLTGVTVRRYMNYLAEAGMVTGEMNYETGGRPCMLYRIAEE
ncbi:MAG: response regulator [Lachnospiraceae bacterium]|nr:response regulator [Lachnospiraceae bacterium]